MSKESMIRDSRFEFLRIVAIFMVVMGHFSVFGQAFRLTEHTNYLDMVGIKFFSIYGEIGVNLFVLITGYFLGNKSFGITDSIKQVWKIWSETIFYTIMLFTIVCLYKGKFIGIKNLIISILPFICRTYWFITAYIMLVLLIPFINKMLLSITKKEFRILIILLLIFNGLFPTIHNFISTNSVGLGIILVPYVVGAYLKNYGLNMKHEKLIIVLLIIFMYVAMIIGAIALGSKNGNGLIMGLLPQLIAILFFNEILKLKPFHSGVINDSATTVFAGYIITEYPPLRLMFWKFIRFSNVNNILFVNILGFITVALILMVVVFFIDKIRQYFFKILKVNSLPNIFF